MENRWNTCKYHNTEIQSNIPQSTISGQKFDIDSNKKAKRLCEHPGEDQLGFTPQQQNLPLLHTLLHNPGKRFAVTRKALVGLKAKVGPQTSAL